MTSPAIDTARWIAADILDRHRKAEPDILLLAAFEVLATAIARSLRANAFGVGHCRRLLFLLPMHLARAVRSHGVPT